MEITEEQVKEIRWLAELVRAQALSEQKMLDREYNGYSDRPWSSVRLDAASRTIARCNRILKEITWPGE